MLNSVQRRSHANMHMQSDLEQQHARVLLYSSSFARYSKYISRGVPRMYLVPPRSHARYHTLLIFDVDSRVSGLL